MPCVSRAGHRPSFEYPSPLYPGTKWYGLMKSKQATTTPANGGRRRDKIRLRRGGAPVCVPLSGPIAIGSGLLPRQNLRLSRQSNRLSYPASVDSDRAACRRCKSQRGVPAKTRTMNHDRCCCASLLCARKSASSPIVPGSVRSARK